MCVIAPARRASAKETPESASSDAGTKPTKTKKQATAPAQTSAAKPKTKVDKVAVEAPKATARRQTKAAPEVEAAKPAAPRSKAPRAKKAPAESAEPVVEQPKPTRTVKKAVVAPEAAPAAKPVAKPALPPRGTGNHWRRMDLHIHTPASTDYQEPAVSYLDILRRAEEQQLDLIAFTDHNSVRGYADMWREIEDLELLEYLKRLQPAEADRLAEYRRLLTAIRVLPGFEFTATFGFHVLAIFPEGTSIRLMEHLLLMLGVPEQRFGSGEVGATSDVLKVYETLAEHGALVIGAHVNSTHGVAMQGLKFGGQTKIAYTQDEHLHALEVTDLNVGAGRRSTAKFFNGSKPEYPRRMHCIQGSDAHRLARDPERETQLGIGDRATEILLPEVSFAALKHALASDNFDVSRPAAGTATDPIVAARLEGETSYQSFHEKVGTRGAALDAVVRDVVAFANGTGGVIYLGVPASPKKPVVGVSEAAALSSRVLSAISTTVTPTVSCEMQQHETGGKDILALVVQEGPDKPYAVSPATILVRRDDTTDVANRDEIVAMISGHASAPPVAFAPTAKLSSRAIAEARPPRAAVQPSGDDPVAPTSGAEVAGKSVANGVTTYTIHDLRDRTFYEGVTLASDRRLWREAITKHEEGTFAQSEVKWIGDYGLWRSYRQRGSERRYHLAYRDGDTIRVFYGVSAAGMHGPWAAFLEQG